MQLRRQAREGGVALIIALMALIVVGGIGLLLFSRTLNEITHSRDDARIVQTLMIARGGANIGSVLMGTTIAAELHDVVESTSKPGRWAYGLDQNPMTDDGPEPTSVANALQTVVNELQPIVNAAVCGNPISIDGNSTVQLRVYFKDVAVCGESLPSSITLPKPRFVEGIPRGGSLDGIQTYALPVVMVADATLGDFRRNIVVQGEYVFDVGQTSFAHYAYFTNRETAGNSRIWFTDKTIIDGPTHSNGNFSFYKTPWFGGRVTSAGCQNQACTGQRKPGAYFYNSQSKITSPNSMTPNMDAPNQGGHAPEFAGGVVWNGPVVDLPTSAYDQEQVARGVSRPNDEGLYFGGNLYSLDLWAGDDAGQTLTKSGGAWTESSWQYIRSCTGSSTVQNTGSSKKPNYVNVFNGTCETWRVNADATMQKLVENGDMSDPADWVTQPKEFNGVIYVNGKVARLTGPDRTSANDPATAPPAIASFMGITIAASNDVRITRDLKYEQPPCSSITHREGKQIVRAECNNKDYANVLGIYSQGGDIVVGNDNYVNNTTWADDLNAPKDVNVHAVLLSATKQVRVEGYQERGQYDQDRGSFYLLGGLIQENRGVFGTFSDSSNTRRGFDRVYTYDPRMQEGVAPPYFPTTGLGDVSFAAFFSFGQREQLY